MSSTDCFIVSQLFSGARHVGCFKLGLKPIQLYIRLSIILLSHLVTCQLRNYKALCSLFSLLTFGLTGYQNSLEELCITRVATVISFTRMLNPPGGG